MKKKVISMSLWCQNTPINKGCTFQTPDMYCLGALENIKLKNILYPDWTLRYYIDNTVPKNIIDNFKEKNVELVDMTGSRIPGMFWRFLAMNDPNIDVFIVRDIDSRLNLREKLAVSEWIKSDKIMHVMRDHPHHYYKILGGMWGFKNNSVKFDMELAIHNFLKLKNYNFKRMDDMNFLNLLYDSMKTHILEHDTFYQHIYKSQDFPNKTNLGKYYNYVGEIYNAKNVPELKKRDTDIFENYKKHIKKF